VLIDDKIDYTNRYKILDAIEKEMTDSANDEKPVECRISAAFGIVDFDPETAPPDITYAELFDIADARMYEKKKEMKKKMNM